MSLEVRSRRERRGTRRTPTCVLFMVSSARADRNRSADARTLHQNWAQLIKRVYEVDPPVCPKCQSEMRIIPFIAEFGLGDAFPHRASETGDGNCAAALHLGRYTSGAMPELDDTTLTVLIAGAILKTIEAPILDRDPQDDHLAHKLWLSAIWDQHLDVYRRAAAR